MQQEDCLRPFYFSLDLMSFCSYHGKRRRWLNMGEEVGHLRRVDVEGAWKLLPHKG